MVIVVGFASQRLLVDVIAGFFILFEDQYGVGDIVRLEPTGYTGEVRTLGLRTTVLLGPGGERMIVPNGQITAVRLIPDGHRRHRLEFLTRDPDAVAAALHELGGRHRARRRPLDAEPRVVRQDGDDGVTRVIAIVDVDAAREDAVAWLADAVARAWATGSRRPRCTAWTSAAAEHGGGAASGHRPAPGTGRRGDAARRAASPRWIRPRGRPPA